MLNGNKSYNYNRRAHHNPTAANRVFRCTPCGSAFHFWDGTRHPCGWEYSAVLYIQEDSRRKTITMGFGTSFQADVLNNILSCAGTKQSEYSLFKNIVIKLYSNMVTILVCMPFDVLSCAECFVRTSLTTLNICSIYTRIIRTLCCFGVVRFCGESWEHFGPRNAPIFGEDLAFVEAYTFLSYFKYFALGKVMSTYWRVCFIPQINKPFKFIITELLRIFSVLCARSVEWNWRATMDLYKHWYDASISFGAILA